jgi:hypothetical protein
MDEQDLAFEEELSNRWDYLRHIAYELEGEPGSEAHLMNAALLSFPECTLDEDLPGYAVRRLLKALLLNRGHKLRRDCPAVVPPTGVRLRASGDW